MTVVSATLKPQGDQSFRCSANFPDWQNPQKDGSLKFQVIRPDGITNVGNPLPMFAIVHDKTGEDKRWYSDVHDGKIISGSDIYGDPNGSYKLYVGTTSQPESGQNGNDRYVVIVWVSE